VGKGIQNPEFRRKEDEEESGCSTFLLNSGF